jgi:hypothetical protein
MQKLQAGESLADIRRQIDAKFEHQRDLATPTPLPPG